jgi:hypothetical protein
MNCHDARLLLAFARPQASELDLAEKQLLDAHLSACPTCTAVAEEQRRVDERIGAVMRDVPVPDGLKERLLVRLANERSAVLRRRAKPWALAAAAAMLLALGIRQWNVAHPPRPVNLEILIAHMSVPKTAADTESQLRTQASLADLELPKDLADQWDFSLLVASQVSQIDGRTFPTLVFRKGESVASVMLVERQTCDPATFNSNYPQQRRLLGNPDKDKYLALVKIESGKYEDFLKRASAPST